ncbi:MAG: hypothetical protein JRN52_11695 [Nitrososphaerota archaeon]|nr:hypothetical protein [Nitrososphaerota archaeon]
MQLEKVEAVVVVEVVVVVEELVAVEVVVEVVVLDGSDGMNTISLCPD